MAIHPKVRPIRALLLWFALLVAAPAFAQPAVTSDRPDSVSVTIYRDSRGGDLDLDWLTGYALITEKRTIRIPAGRSLIRFEGVAGGILPESAIVAGLPDGVREKNLDADLLSSRTLFGRSYGRPVTITRRNKDGTLSSERAIIRSAPDGAAVLQTKDGFITASCTGNESLIYDAVPEGLSARPTLSIETNSPEAREVTVTLSYLSWGFDWQVNYVATMRPDGKSADLTAWVTLANSDVTSFADAETMLVAGSTRRVQDADDREEISTGGALNFQCLATQVKRVIPLPGPPPPLYEGQIVVTGMRNSSSVVDSITAEDIGAENLGDLKLYRVPERTNVGSNSMKQVLMFERSAIPVELVHRARIDREDAQDVYLYLRLQNRKARGLGIPLPRGNLALFEPVGDRRLLVGEGSTYDRPVDAEFDIDIGYAEQVRIDWQPAEPRGGWEDRWLLATNANPYPVRFEALIDTRERDAETDEPKTGKPPRADAKLTRRGSYWVWSIEIPANSSVTLRFRK